MTEAVARSCFVKKAEACNFIEKETQAQVFSCEFYEISKNTFPYRTPPVAASGQYLEYILKRIFIGKNRSSYSFKKLQKTESLHPFSIIAPNKLVLNFNHGMCFSNLINPGLH